MKFLRRIVFFALLVSTLSLVSAPVLCGHASAGGLDTSTGKPVN